MNLSQKERTLLEDQKSHEEICIQKYNNYAELTQCQQLKNMFKQIAQTEQEHYNTINQLLQGQIPQMQQSGSQQSGGSQQQGGQQQAQMSMSAMQMNQQSSSFMPQGQQQHQNYSTSDKDLCTDLLMTEKYVSGAYNTAIFEFSDPQIRNILNHIQKEEQQHGESIFKYMESKGMYQVK